jgi:Zn-dependent membrane protease YugP
MPILIILGILALLALIYGPQYWVKSVMARHAADRPDFPGTGGELARHLLDEAGLADVGLEETPAGTDHYDPIARVVRLSPNNLTGHEVGHAVQHRDGDAFLVTRTKWAGGLAGLDKMAFWMLISIPLIGIIIKSPMIAMLQISALVALMSGRVLMHVLTLPMEIDASFKRALPVLENGGFLSGDDLANARQVLKAAAGTYVASALATLLDVIRWIR